MIHLRPFTICLLGVAAAASVTAQEIYSNSFEPSVQKKFTLRSEAKLAEGEGVNGSAALKIERTDAKKYSVSGASLGKLAPGEYVLTLKMRTENICNAQGKPSPNIQFMAVEHYQGKKYLSQNSSFFKVPAEGKWADIKFSFKVPAGADRSGLSIFLRKNMTGTVWLDDIKIISANAVKAESLDADISVEQAESFPQDKSGTVIYSTSFEPSEQKKYNLRAGTTIVDKEGFNGTHALKMVRTDKKQYSVSGCALGKLEPGTYTLTMKLRAENICGSSGKKSSTVQVMAFEHYNGKRYISQNTQFFRIPPAGSWADVKFTFKAPAGATRSSLSFFIRKGMTGSVWIDDVKVFQAADEIPAVNLLKPERLTVFGNKTEIVLNNTLNTPPGTTALITLNKQSKLVKSGSDGLFRASFDNLPEGTVPLEIKILDLKNKVFKSKSTFNIFVKPATQEPDYAVKFDHNKNLLVNGKPYMIVGIYSLSKHAEKVAAAGFNTIIDYTLFGDKGEKVNRIANIRKRLDDLHKHNIKALVSVQHQYPGRASASTSFDNISGEYNCVTAAAEGIKDHPALLGWYVSDEMPRDGLPMVHKIREAVSIADPWHPTYTLTCRVEDMPVYADSGDVIGMDPYPINSQPGKHSIRPVAEQTEMCVKTGQSVWMTHQGFNWSVYDNTPAEKYSAARKITADEIAAMPLLAAICGAKGFIFYSYDGAVSRTEKKSPEDAQYNWNALTRAAGLLNDLAPFITSGITEDIKFEANQAGNFKGKIFKDGKGNVRVVLVGMHGKAVARFFLKQYPNLKSTTGLTKLKKNNLYEINVEGVQFDILKN